jgi:hypothetical protein
VKVDPSWVGPGGFERFLEHLGERPEGTTLGRIGDEGDLRPRECQVDEAPWSPG